MNDWLRYLDGISEEQLAQARAADERGQAEQWLLDQALVNKEAILTAKAKFFRLPFVALSGYHPSHEATELVTEDQARKLGIMPLFCIQDRLYVAMTDPYDLRCEDFVRKLTGRRVKPVLADSEEISEAITRRYLATQMGVTFVPENRLADRDQTPLGSQGEEEGMVDLQSPVIKLVWKIITQAVRLGASDIHLEPDKNTVFMRYRIDGILHDYPPPDVYTYPAVVSRIKVIAGMDIAERRLPQDGRLTVDLDARSYDLRVSLLPGVHGEGVCIRILDPKAANLDLSEMGFDPDTLKRYDRVIRKPYGIVLVTGPTGSGKSTTLYATLRRIKTREVKIITVEDPVEYKVPGLVQIPINPDIGYSFEAGLRAILRHDPDIIMLGEIRDLPSAEMAFRAALTGHLLFSTLHTNTASQALTRLVDMGLPEFQVMAALSAVLAQRLVRKLCSDCKRAVTLEPEELRALGVESVAAGREVYEAVGCNNCQGIGYRGRTAIHEFLEVTPDMRQLGAADLTPARIEKLARLNGFRSLRESAVDKLLAGVISYSEVLAVTAAD